LYLVTDRPLCLGRELISVVMQAVQGGVTVVQLREKEADTRDFVELARSLKSSLGRKNVPLFINDRIDVAQACRADGVHVGQSDMDVEDVRGILGSEALVGLSVETAVQADAARNLDIDYIGVGPVFPTSTKLDAGPALGLEGFQNIRQIYGKTTIAIGAIAAHNAADIAAAGADGIAVVSAICSADSPQQSAEELLLRFKSGRKAFS
jgi:thiamine-phosphate pyrophosphorylase